jgi:hypothetical protein
LKTDSGEHVEDSAKEEYRPIEQGNLTKKNGRFRNFIKWQIPQLYFSEPALARDARK